MAGELGSFIFVDGMGDIRAGTLDLNFAADTSLGSMSAGTLSYNTAGTG